MTKRLSLTALTMAAFIAGAGAATGQALPEVPSWDAPADSTAEPAGKKAKPAAKKTAKQRSSANEPAGGSVSSPMRRIDRSDIDMSGTGTEREGASRYRPMIKPGGVGMGTSF